MGGGVAVDLAPVVGAGDDFPCTDGDGSNRNVTVFGGASSFVKRLSHPLAVVHRGGHYNMARRGGEKSVEVGGKEKQKTKKQKNFTAENAESAEKKQEKNREKKEERQKIIHRKVRKERKGKAKKSKKKIFIMELMMLPGSARHRDENRRLPPRRLGLKPLGY